MCTLVNSAYRGELAKEGWTTEAHILDGQRTDEKGIAEMLKLPESVILVAETPSKEILACVHLQHSGATSYLGMLTVNPSLQNKGVGRQLLSYAEKFTLQTWNSEGMHMTVISSRDTLIAWYQRRGYRLTGERRPFPMNDVRFGIPIAPLQFVVMSKSFLIETSD